MPCISCNWWGWKCMTALTAVEILVAFLSSLAWGTGFTEYVLEHLVDSVNCRGPCLKVAHLSFHDWQVVASVLYGIAIFFAILSLLGLLSGQLSLQVPNVVFCILKIACTIYICEKLLDVNLGTRMYKANRIFLYCATVWNALTLCFNISQVQSEKERLEMEKSGMRPAEIRPLTEAFAPYFQNCNWCHCGEDNGNTYAVNSNEIRVPIHDSLDGRDPHHDTSVPLLSPTITSTLVDGSSVPTAIEASVPAEGAKTHSVVDMGDKGLLDVEKLGLSDVREDNELKDSVASSQSEEMSLSKDEMSRKRKYSRNENSSRDSSQSVKSLNDSRDRTSDNNSEDGEPQDAEPLLKDR